MRNAGQTHCPKTTACSGKSPRHFGPVAGALLVVVRNSEPLQRACGTNFMSMEVTFAALPCAAIDDERLTEIDLKVVCAVALHDRFGKNRQACWATRDTLANETRFNATNVSNSLSKLTKLGYLKTDARGSDRRKKSYSVCYGLQRWFARIPSRAVSDRNLTKALFRTLAVISAHDSGKGKGCFATVSKLALRAGLDTKTIERSITALIAAGYVLVSVSPIFPARRTLYIAAWRQDADTQIQASRSSEEADVSELDFDGAVRERLPYGLSLRIDRLPDGEANAIRNNGLAKSIYCSEELYIKNPAEADAWENAAAQESPFSEAVETMAALGVNRTIGWSILQGLPEPQLYQFLVKASEGCLTPSDIAGARMQALGHLN